MSFISEMTNEELIKEFERIINRMQSYSASNEQQYKEKLEAELLNRLNKNTQEREAAIQKIIDEKTSNFDIYNENGEWIVQTSFCQMGGCVADYIPCESEEAAKRLAAELTIQGKKPSSNGLCSSCRNDYYEMQV